MSACDISPYIPLLRAQVIALSLRCWTPVFKRTPDEVPGFVFDNFYPEGWEARQRADLGATLDADPRGTWVASVGGQLAGFLCLRLHPQDHMGEIHVLAVDPDYQRRGIGRALLRFGEDRIRSAGMRMVMVETIGDSGHAPARATYEATGYTRWPAARYFKPL